MGKAGMTPTATTIVVAREDFSIPGGDTPSAEGSEPTALETRFFSLLRESQPDVVVLDLSRANGDGAGMIHKIRRASSVPILVVYGDDARHERDYRDAGAAQCIPGPVDLVGFNRVIRQITQGEEQPSALPAPLPQPGVFRFAGVSFQPQQALLVAANGRRTQLTAAESRLLAHFAARAWELQTREALAEVLQGEDSPATDRAIDVTVNRLRVKLRSIGTSSQDLIKTEFRRGYRFVADAAVEP